MTAHPVPTEAEVQALSEHRKRWGLDAAPTYARQVEQREAKAKAITSIKQSFGTPLDIVRGLLSRQPPKEWVEDVARISPPSEESSYLRLFWKAPPFALDEGRWTLYECIPDKLITTERRMELASTPFWERPKAERAGQAQIVSAFQWELYRRDRLDVRPFWCLQGTEGGTPFHMDRLEQRYLRMMGKPSEPLPLGALPYAPWDARSRDAVLKRDRLVKFGGSLAKLRASGQTAVLNAALAEQEKAYRRMYWDWAGEKFAPHSELLAYCVKQEDADRVMRQQSREDAIAAAEAKDHFIETGRLPDPIQYRKRTIAV